MESVWMNIIDSVRELAVLTMAGIIVYKLDHRELVAWIMGSTGCDKDQAKCKLGKCKLAQKELVEELNDSDN